MFQRFILEMAARDKNGMTIKTQRKIFGDDSSILQTAELLFRLAVMDGLKDIHVVGVYSEVPSMPPILH